MNEKEIIKLIIGSNKINAATEYFILELIKKNKSILNSKDGIKNIFVKLIKEEVNNFRLTKENEDLKSELKSYIR
jgi:hypothetical protein